MREKKVISVSNLGEREQLKSKDFEQRHDYITSNNAAQVLTFL